MKTIGTLKNTDGYLVEMTTHEYNTFSALVDAVIGSREYYNFPYDPNSIDYNLAATFDSIRLFVRAKFKVNELKYMISELESKLCEPSS